MATLLVGFEIQLGEGQKSNGHFGPTYEDS